MKKPLYLIIPLCLLLTGTLFAQTPPANDLCANATILTASVDTSCVPITESFADALQEFAPSTCPGQDDSPSAFDIWYQFSATDATQIVDVTTLAQGGPGNGVGAVVVLYDACGGAELACANPTIIKFGPFTFVQSGLTRLTATNLTIGNNYFIRVYNYGDTLPAAGDDLFEICVHTAVDPPVNDTCTGATPLTVGTACVPTNGTLNGANQENPALACGAEAASNTAFDIWYSFTANQSNEIIEVATVTQNDGTAAVIEVYDNCSGTPLDCANPAIFPGFGGIPGTTSLNYNGYTIGNTYLVRVYHYGDAAAVQGDITICVYDAPPPPSNDICTNAIALTVLDTCNPTIGTLTSATEEMPSTACGADPASGTATDVWYSFQAINATQLIEVSPLVGQGGVAPVIELYDICAGAQLACANPTIIPGFGAIPGTTVLTATGLTPGTSYQVRVYHYGDNPATDGSMAICVYNAPPPPVNDTCSGAIALTVDAVCNPTTGSLESATEESPAEFCNTIQSTTATDVWYSFNPANSDEIVEVSSQDFDPIVIVYDACGGNLVDCANPDGSGTTMVPLSGLTPGNDYFVRVYSDGPLPGPGDFTICVYDLPATEPNDECADAILITQADSKVDCVPTPVSTVNATESAEVSFCGPNAIDDDVWYQFVATSTEVVASASAKSVSLTGVNIGFTMYRNSCSGQQSAECAGGAAGDSLLFRNLVIGDTYFLRTYTRNNTARGTYSLCVYKNIPAPRPANDTCSAAILVTATNSDTCITPLNGTLLGAIQENPVDSCNGQKASPSASDVWFKFTAVANAQDVEVRSQNVAAVVALYESNGADCGSFNVCQNPRLITIGPNTFGAPGTTKLKALGLTVGSSYFVRVFHYGAGVPANPNFTICVFRDSAATSGITDLNALEQSLSLYPNPTKDKIELSFSVSSKVNIRVMSLTGQLVFSENIDRVNGSYHKSIDLSSVAKGVYTIQIVTDKESITRKVIRE